MTARRHPGFSPEGKERHDAKVAALELQLATLTGARTAAANPGKGYVAMRRDSTEWGAKTPLSAKMEQMVETVGAMVPDTQAAAKELEDLIARVEKDSDAYVSHSLSRSLVLSLALSLSRPPSRPFHSLSAMHRKSPHCPPAKVAVYTWFLTMTWDCAHLHVHTCTHACTHTHARTLTDAHVCTRAGSLCAP